MAEDAGRFVDAVPRDAELVLALDAYRRGDWPKASLHCRAGQLQRLRGSDPQSAALGQLGSSQAAQSLLTSAAATRISSRPSAIESPRNVTVLRSPPHSRTV